MVFKCQEDSFLKEYVSTVISCQETKFTSLINGKETELKGYDVILEDTILFPEGGGQPSDHGFLNDSKVYHVKRIGGDAVHFVDKPLNAGQSVTQIIDWERRFDHMQQHSGQHLITAIIDREFGFATVSWYLGEQISYIELDTPTFTIAQMETVENIINELIRDDKKVTVNIFKSVDELKNVRARGLPNDHVGDVRVITIDGIDSNMCCGTHVSSLSQLQVVKLVNREVSKRKNKMLLYFLVGNRVLNRLSDCLKREQQLTILLKSNPIEHPNLVEKLQKNVKSLNKSLQNVLKDVALFEAQKFKCLSPVPKYYVLHRKEADPEFINNFLREVAPVNCCIFLSVGDDITIGNIVLYGRNEIITELSKQVLEILDGKGVVKNSKLQAKVNNMKNRPKVELLLEEYFKENSM